MRILLVEDNIDVSRCIQGVLKRSLINVFTTHRGVEAVELATLYDHDLIILDLRLPDISGQEVLRRLRNAGIGSPVLILSSACDTESKLEGFKLGADDYLPKPFLQNELVARIHIIVRRYWGHSNSEIRTGDIVVNLDLKSAQFAGRCLQLTKTEYQVLELLSLRKGTTITKKTIMDQLYGGKDEPAEKIVDQIIFKLRKKVSAVSGGENCIKTVRHRGYMLCDHRSSRVRGAEIKSPAARSSLRLPSPELCN